MPTAQGRKEEGRKEGRKEGKEGGSNSDKI